MNTEQEPSYRYADREGQGWLRNGPDDTYTTYPQALDPLTYEDLKAQRGPLRPIGLMEDGDSEQLADALAKAGKKGLATLLAALHRSARNLIDDGGSIAVLTAGRTGSWEASLFRGEIIWIADGMSNSRVDQEAFDVAAALLDKWMTGPVQPELADNLAGILGDAAKKAGGWNAITDRWLMGNSHIERWTAAYHPS